MGAQGSSTRKLEQMDVISLQSHCSQGACSSPANPRAASQPDSPQQGVQLGGGGPRLTTWPVSGALQVERYCLGLSPLPTRPPSWSSVHASQAVSSPTPRHQVSMVLPPHQCATQPFRMSGVEPTRGCQSKHLNPSAKGGRRGHPSHSMVISSGSL